MSINYKKEMDKAIYKKLNALVKNEIRITLNKFQLEFGRESSYDFRLTFIKDIRTLQDTAIYSLYIDRINQNFDDSFAQKAQALADRYRTNQLKQLINKAVQRTFNEEFKADLQKLLINIGKNTMKRVQF